MDADSAQDLAHLRLTDHSWYRLGTVADFVAIGHWGQCTQAISAAFQQGTA